ncbi:MAG: hypothetical protein Rubg2KO_13860 [Rubricoccaceae bacterium]
MRQLVALLAVIFVTAPADAQRRRHHSFAKKGDVALVAQLNGLSVQAFNPSLGGLGLRVRLADQTAIGVGFGATVFDGDGDQQVTATEVRGTEYSGTNLSGSLWLEQHVGARRRTVSPFIGGGVSVGYLSDDRTQARPFPRCDDTGACEIELADQVNESSRVSVQAGLILGAEVRVVKGVTLGGGYALGAGYTWWESRRVEVRGDGEQTTLETSQGTFQLGTASSGLNLSIYF